MPWSPSKSMKIEPYPYVKKVNWNEWPWPDIRVATSEMVPLIYWNEAHQVVLEIKLLFYSILHRQVRLSLEVKARGQPAACSASRVCGERLFSVASGHATFAEAQTNDLPITGRDLSPLNHTLSRKLWSPDSPSCDIMATPPHTPISKSPVYVHFF